MLIIPAIDIIDGKCVRLTEGDYDSTKVYNDNPIEIAKQFADYGAKRIHVIDLNAAKNGSSYTTRHIVAQIKKATNLEIEFGGGIRTEEDVKQLIYEGIDKLILGTVVSTRPDEVAKWLKEYEDSFIAAVDVRNGNVRTNGWLKDEGVSDIAYGKKIFSMGFTTAIYTDISKDGKLCGPNVNATRTFSDNTGLHAIVSGGVSSIEDVAEAATLKGFGIVGVIVGKAFYEGKIDLAEAIKKYQD